MIPVKYHCFIFIFFNFKNLLHWFFMHASRCLFPPSLSALDLNHLFLIQDG
jgi:hypothetical protein